MSTPEERKAAAEIVREAGIKSGDFLPGIMAEWLTSAYVSGMTKLAIDLQCDLTTAIELLRELDALLEKQGYMPKGKSRGKIAAFLSATNGGK